MKIINGNILRGQGWTLPQSFPSPKVTPHFNSNVVERKRNTNNNRTKNYRLNFQIRGRRHLFDDESISGERCVIIGIQEEIRSIF